MERLAKKERLIKKRVILFKNGTIQLKMGVRLKNGTFKLKTERSIKKRDVQKENGLFRSNWAFT